MCGVGRPVRIWCQQRSFCFHSCSCVRCPLSDARMAECHFQFAQLLVTWLHEVLIFCSPIAFMHVAATSVPHTLALGPRRPRTLRLRYRSDIPSSVLVPAHAHIIPPALDSRAAHSDPGVRPVLLMHMIYRAWTCRFTLSLESWNLPGPDPVARSLPGWLCHYELGRDCLSRLSSPSHLDPPGLRGSPHALERLVPHVPGYAQLVHTHTRVGVVRDVVGDVECGLGG
jgi:hypothetical protein